MKLLNLKKQMGISLVEIMVAMVISIFLLGGVIQVYIGNKTTYRFADASARIQENARFALETMASDVRMAGFWGCAQFLGNNKHMSNDLNKASSNYKAFLHDYINNDAIEATENDGLNASDSLTVRASKAGQSILVAPFMTSETSTITVDRINNIEANDIVILSNCKNADVFEVTSVAGNVISHTGGAQTGSPGNLSGALTQIFDGTTSPAIVALQTITYSIKAGASGEPALWRSVNGKDEELIESIEQMQVLFGIDNTGDGKANQYVTSNNVGTAVVGAIRIFLVVRSDVDNITDNFQVFNVNGDSNTATDKRLRQVFTITIALRNRT